MFNLGIAPHLILNAILFGLIIPFLPHSDLQMFESKFGSTPAISVVFHDGHLPLGHLETFQIFDTVDD